MATDIYIRSPDARRSGAIAGYRPGLLVIALIAGLLLATWIFLGAPLPVTVRQVIHWSPALLGGFGVNILISVLAMTLGTLGGLLVCVLRLSPFRLFRAAGGLYVQIFRNAPKLVLVYFASYVFPFELFIGGHYLPFPDWLKVTMGLALPASAYSAEIFRGAIQSIPSAQWEAARSLAFSRIQQLRFIILPQCIKRMLPPWMSLYSVITMSSALASLVGSQDLLNVAQTASATVHSTSFTIAIYFTVMALFFAYCYPLSLLTRRLERAYGKHR